MSGRATGQPQVTRKSDSTRYDIEPTFFVVNPDTAISHMMRIYGYNEVQNIKEASIVLWGGGPDVHPMLYGQGMNPTCHVDFARDRRDIEALRLINENQTLVGICRGAQFLNVMVGNGSLYQDVDGHATRSMHEAWTGEHATGRSIMVTSTHHQMMIPGPNASVFLRARQSFKKFGVSAKTPIKFYRGVTDLYEDPPQDIEAVIYYWSTTWANVLCYQPHPEYMGSPSCDDNTEYFFELLENYCLSKTVVEKAQDNRKARLKGFRDKRAKFINMKADQPHVEKVQGVSCG